MLTSVIEKLINSVFIFTPNKTTQITIPRNSYRTEGHHKRTHTLSNQFENTPRIPHIFFPRRDREPPNKKFKFIRRHRNLQYTANQFSAEHTHTHARSSSSRPFEVKSRKKTLHLSCRMSSDLSICGRERSAEVLVRGGNVFAWLSLKQLFLSRLFLIINSGGKRRHDRQRRGQNQFERERAVWLW